MTGSTRRGVQASGQGGRTVWLQATYNPIAANRNFLDVVGYGSAEVVGRVAVQPAEVPADVHDLAGDHLDAEQDDAA